MNTIELMLKPLRTALEAIEALGLADDEYTVGLRAAIAAGEAELRREPVAWVDWHGNIERGWDAILNPNEFTPLYTRGEA